jgi:trimethylamine corrinoid protein
MESLVAEARQAILSYNHKKAADVAKKAIDESADLVVLIENGLTKAMVEIGDAFNAKKLYLPHIVAAAAAMNAAMEILTPELERRGGSLGEGLGRFVICSIEGDIHSIGKDIVATMLKIAGFNVINLGRDVLMTDIVKACENEKPVAVGTSALMTNTMINQKTLEEMLKKVGIRDKLLTNVGGAPVTQQWADEIGASVYSENASDAVVKMTAAVKKKK